MWRAASSVVRPHIPMPPRPPALLTAAARAGVVIIPIGARMIGNLRLSRSVRRFDGHIVPSRPPCRFYDGADFEWQDSDFTSTARKAGAQKSASGAKPEAADLEQSFRSAPIPDFRSMPREWRGCAASGHWW